MHLVWNVEVRQQTGYAAQCHGHDVGVHVLEPVVILVLDSSSYGRDVGVQVREPVHVDPYHCGGEQENTGVLIARAKTNKECARAKRGHVCTADATDCEVDGACAQHVVQREHFALDAIQPHLCSNVVSGTRHGEGYMGELWRMTAR